MVSKLFSQCAHCNTHLRVTDELHGTALVRRKASDLADNAPDGLDALAGDALLGDTLLRGHAALGLVTAVDTPNETCTLLASMLSHCEEYVPERGTPAL